jgi:hypothetical protein
MKNRNEETGLMIRKDTFWAKVKRNVLCLFFYRERKMLKLFHQLERPKDKPKKEIIVPQDKEREKLLRLQEKYRKGILKENDLGKEIVDKLILLYKSQNILLKNEIRQVKQQMLQREQRNNKMIQGKSK